jgi:hypothetical protein
MAKYFGPRFRILFVECSFRLPWDPAQDTTTGLDLPLIFPAGFGRATGEQFSFSCLADLQSRCRPRFFGSVCKSWCGSPCCCCLGLRDLVIIFFIQRQVLILILVCVIYPSSVVHEPGFGFHLYRSRSSFPWQRFAGLLVLSSCLLPVALPAQRLLGFVLLSIFSL